MKVLDLFSGIGGFSLGLERAGMETVAFCEIEPFCQKVLAKHWPDVPIYSDIEDLICDLRSITTQLSAICDLPSKQRQQEELSASVNTVQKTFQFRRALPQEGKENTVAGSVGQKQCAAATGPTPAAVSGCGEGATQTGKAVKAENESPAKIKRSQISGADGCLRETATPAKAVDLSRKRKTNLTLTTSSIGQPTRNCDSESAMESPFASLATKLLTDGIDVITAGFPCQPASTAGKRKGTEDDRWLWPRLIEVVRLVKARWLLFENVRGLLTLEDGMVFESCISDLEALGYEVETFVIPACAVDAKHRRDRVWILGNSNSNSKPTCSKHDETPFVQENDVPNSRHTEPPGRIQSEADHDGCGRTGKSEGCKSTSSCGDVADSNNKGPQRMRPKRAGTKQQETIRHCRPDGESHDWTWPTEPAICRVANGIPNRVHRLKSLGNAVVPQVVEVLGRAIMETVND